MTATVTFRLWIERECGPSFEWGGEQWEPNDALLYEYDAIHEAGPRPLEDSECEALGMPVGTTNAEAHAELRKIWPLRT